MPNRRFSGGSIRLGLLISEPKSETVPRSGFSNPAISLSRVDFPQPEGPKIDADSDSSSSNPTPVTASMDS